MTFLALTILILTGCNSSNNGASMITDSLVNTVPSQNSNPPGNLFTLADAEKIMGEPAHLIDSTSKIKGENPKYIDSMSMIKKDAFIYSSGYMANSRDKKTGRTGVVYFGLEEYADVTSAKNVYSFYKNANKNTIGFKELHDMGDEAWFGESPLFVYVRKADKIFVIKVNKMTSMTSQNEFNLIAKKIAKTL
jgi:hypothetical protein